MADQDDVRRIALSLPGTREADDHFGFSVLNKGKPKGFVWAWNERVEPKKPKVPNPEVVAVRVAAGWTRRRCSPRTSGSSLPSRTTTGFPRSWSGCRRSSRMSSRS